LSENFNKITLLLKKHRTFFNCIQRCDDGDETGSLTASETDLEPAEDAVKDDEEDDSPSILNNNLIKVSFYLHVAIVCFEL